MDHQDHPTDTGAATARLCALCATREALPVQPLCSECYETHVCSRHAVKRPRKTARPPLFLTDVDGASIALVLTQNPGKTVKVLAEDYRRVVEKGFRGNWSLANVAGYEYAYVTVRGRSFPVARIIVEPGPGTAVQFKDGDALNLRRDNLAIVRGSAKGREELAARQAAMAHLQAI